MLAVEKLASIAELAELADNVASSLTIVLWVRVVGVRVGASRAAARIGVVAVAA